MSEFTRRKFLLNSALAGAALAARPASAATPPTGKQGPGVYRYKLGTYQLTALYDGTWFLPIDDKLVRNASSADVNRELAAAFLAPAR